jgi:hypothetical protein
VLGLIKPKYRLRVNVRLQVLLRWLLPWCPHKRRAWRTCRLTRALVQREYVAEEAEKLRSSNGSARKVLGPPGPQVRLQQADGRK